MEWINPGMCFFSKGNISVYTAYMMPKAPGVGFMIALGLLFYPVKYPS